MFQVISILQMYKKNINKGNYVLLLQFVKLNSNA